MKSTAIMAAEEESLSLHIDIGGIGSNGGDFIGEEDGGGVEMLAHTVPNHTS